MHVHCLCTIIEPFFGGSHGRDRAGVGWGGDRSLGRVTIEQEEGSGGVGGREAGSVGGPQRVEYFGQSDGREVGHLVGQKERKGG